MLHHQQRTAGFEDAADFVQAAQGVGHGAEDEGADGAIKSCICEG